MVWVWSDLHLGEVDVLTFFGRPFRSVDEMDDMLFEQRGIRGCPDRRAGANGSGTGGTGFRTPNRGPGRRSRHRRRRQKHDVGFRGVPPFI